MTNRDEITKSVDEMLAGWFDGERYDVDKNDIVELVMKHISVGGEPFGWIKPGAAVNDEKYEYEYGMFAYSQQEDTSVAIYTAPPAPSVTVKALEWVEQINDDWWIADRYRVERCGGSQFACRSKGPQSGAFNTLSYEVSFEAAKAAAQADYEARIRSALSAQVQDVAEDGERVKAAFNHGYVIACCNITNLHDEPGIAHDTLRELGVTKAEVKKMGLCDYDAKALREIERARGRNSAVYAAAPAKQDG